jgi:hypothetical protein
VPNQTNAVIIEEFRAYMKARGSSEQHQNTMLQVVIAFANYLGSDKAFGDVQSKDQILLYLHAAFVASSLLVSCLFRKEL